MKASQYLRLLTVASVIWHGTTANLPDVHGAEDLGPSIVPGAYIVEFAKEQDIDGFYEGLRSQGIGASHRTELRYKLFKGASFQLNSNDSLIQKSHVSELSQNQNIKNIWPVRSFRFPKLELRETVHGASARDDSALFKSDKGLPESAYPPHVMSQVDKLRKEGKTGAGIRLAVVDTGIDYLHPALGGCFGDGCLVAFGYDLVGDKFSAQKGSIPEPDPDPYESCWKGGLYHGTHVSGIIAAQPNSIGMTGVAPDVTLGMYKTCGCGGYTTNEILIAAFNMAYEDGADIISCSAGDDSGWAADPGSLAASRIAEAGVPVIVAPGNSGVRGPWLTASPASGPKVVAAGSFDPWMEPTIGRRATYNVKSANGTSYETVFGWKTGLPAFSNISLPVWSVSLNETSGSDGCALPDELPNLVDKAVLIRMPDFSFCTTNTQAINLANRGAKYVTWYADTSPHLINVILPMNTPGLLGVGIISPALGAEWITLLRSGAEVVVDFVAADAATKHAIYVPYASGSYPSSFSTWGPTWDVYQKPQMAAPGGVIMSTMPENGWGVASGTSMSTPFLAAAHAIVAEARNTLDPQTLTSVLFSTAKANYYWDSINLKSTTILSSVAKQGAGLVQVYDAAHAAGIVSVSGISFNDTDHFQATQTFNILNVGNEDATYALGHTKAATVLTFVDNHSPALGTAAEPGTNTVEVYADISFGSSTIHVPAGGEAEITVTATPPEGLNGTLLPIYSGYITLNGTNGDALSVHFIGIAGSLQRMPVLQTATTFLVSSSSHFLIPISANTTFRLPPVYDPSVAYPRLVLQPLVRSLLIRADVVVLSSSVELPRTEFNGFETIGQIMMPIHLAGRVLPTVILQGTLIGGTRLPNGTYQVAISALKMHGTETKQDDWQVLRSVPFKIENIS